MQMEHYIFSFKSFWRIVFFCNFAADSNGPKGWRVEILLEKDVYERYLRLSNLANSSPEETQPKRPRWVYCTLLMLFGHRQYILAWAIELLILDKAMREPDSGISEVEHPRLSI